MEEKGHGAVDGGGETPRTTAVQTLDNRDTEQRKTSGEPPTASIDTLTQESTGGPRQRSNTPEEHQSTVPPAKRFKAISEADVSASEKVAAVAKGDKTPAIVSERDSSKAASHIGEGDVGYQSKEKQHSLDKKPPAAVAGGKIDRSGSISPSSDISSHSGSSSQRKYDVASPVPPTYAQEVPPAPPSTPASLHSTAAWDPGLATPLPFQEGVRNASLLEQQQMLSDGGVTPAPTRPESAGGRVLSMTEDFSEWAVGDRYEMIRILGRGSYGEVAQAVDKYAGRPDAYVAIKRILSPFDQEIDAVRLYREIHILRRLRGHSCIINLLDVVQPPTDDLDDFHDLYLVFECKLQEKKCGARLL